MSHHQDEPAKLERLHKINEYHFQQFAYLVDKLSKLREGNGTMLDNSLFLYGTGISDSNTHFHDDLPIALVGGQAAGLKGAALHPLREGDAADQPLRACWNSWESTPRRSATASGKVDRLTTVDAAASS